MGFSTPLTAEQTATVAASKQVIYDGLKLALTKYVPREAAGILVDEQKGAAILRDARERPDHLRPRREERPGLVPVRTRRSLRRAHRPIFKPTFVKVLVRYNPESDEAVNRLQAARLRELADYVHKSNQHFMFESLLPMTQERRRSATGAIRWEVLRPAPSTQLNHHVLCQTAMKASPTARERRAGRCGYFTAYSTALRHEDG